MGQKVGGPIRLETYFHFDLSLPSRSSQLGEGQINGIKHIIHKE